jgi:hypothetical protein
MCVQIYQQRSWYWFEPLFFKWSPTFREHRKESTNPAQFDADVWIALTDEACEATEDGR